MNSLRQTVVATARAGRPKWSTAPPPTSTGDSKLTGSVHFLPPASLACFRHEWANKLRTLFRELQDSPALVNIKRTLVEGQT
jgi:hypothetical protein